MSLVVEEAGGMLEAIEETGAGMEAAGELASGELKSAEEILTETNAEVQKVEDEIKIQEQDAFENGMDEVKKDVETLKKPTLAEKAAIKARWVVKNMWESKYTFGRAVGIEVAKGALFTAGMVAVQKIAEAIEKKTRPSGNLDDKTALVLANQLANVAQSMQTILGAWLLWFANHYDTKDSYGSVNVEGTDISRFQIVQSKISGATTVLEKEVAPAITVATRNNNLAAMKSLKAAYVSLCTKIVAVSDDITSKEQKMVDDGLDAFKKELDAVKAILDAA